MILNCSKTHIAAMRALLFAGSAMIVLSSCSQRPTSPSERLAIVLPQGEGSGVITWNPNDDPVFVLSAAGLSESGLAQVIWHQTGLPLDDSDWRGRNLILPAGVPGCGYGGVSFVVTATAPETGQKASLSVHMEPYICSGSPWVTP